MTRKPQPEESSVSDDPIVAAAEAIAEAIREQQQEIPERRAEYRRMAASVDAKLEGRQA